MAGSTRSGAIRRKPIMTDQGIMVGRSKHSFVCSCSALEPRCIARSGGTPERIIEVPGRVSGIGKDDVGSSVFKILASTTSGSKWTLDFVACDLL